ncbi:MAG: flagellar biosynthesis anti-sigma factor FlgM [Geopsychrobacter sp.]|nr:flagellar biosynthesis anti-sigma factor FlgM [Geopsychrobacter sp.]
MVNSIGGGKGFGPLDGIRKQPKAEAKKAASKAPSTDRVNFSSVLQNASQTQEVASSQTSARAEKLQTLKGQIASGQYRPDLERVAERMMKFILEDS